jgi:hypothetical protein
MGMYILGLREPLHPPAWSLQRDCEACEVTFNPLKVQSLYQISKGFDS